MPSESLRARLFRPPDYLSLQGATGSGHSSPEFSTSGTPLCARLSRHDLTFIEVAKSNTFFGTTDEIVRQAIALLGQLERTRRDGGRTILTRPPNNVQTITDLLEKSPPRTNIAHAANNDNSETELPLMPADAMEIESIALSLGANTDEALRRAIRIYYEVVDKLAQGWSMVEEKSTTRSLYGVRLPGKKPIAPKKPKKPSGNKLGKNETLNSAARSIKLPTRAGEL